MFIRALAVTTTSVSLALVTVMGFGVTSALADSVPRVNAISPTSGPTTGGTSVIISGTGFATGDTVSFGTAPSSSVTVASSISITAVAPAGTAGTVSVVVTDTNGSGMGTVNFTYAAAPTMTGVTPNNGSTTGGTSVTINGTNFGSDSSVAIGGATATGVVVVDSTQITAVTPPGTTGSQDVTVTDTGGSATLAGGFIYGAPTVTSITPIFGPSSGGTSVTINGTNFGSDSSVTIGGATATGVVVVDPTQITAVTSAGVAGTAAVVVTDTAGAGTGTNIFTYGTAPSITGVTITGTPSLLQVLNASASGVTGDPVPLASYQWLSDGIPISGATSSTYIVSGADVGSSLAVTITESNGVGAAASATSNPVAVPLLSSALEITTTSSSSTHGSPVAFTAVVSPSTATGTVTFKSGSTVFGSCTLSSGTCAVVTSSLAVGTDAMSATYTGDSLDSASTSATFAYTVTRIVSSVSLLAIPARTSALHSSVRFKADVSPSTARGTVTFKNGSTILGSCRLSSGRCAFTTTSLPGGTDTIRASYQPNAQDSSKYTSATSNPQVELVLVSIPVATSATQRLTRPALGNQVLSGFAPSSAVAIQAVGSRTVSSFELSSGLINDSSLSLAISSSASQQGAGFAQVTSVAAVSNARARNFAGIQGVAAATVNRYLSDSSLQPPRMVNSYLGTPGHKWVEITVEVSSYVPGTIAFLAVTTRPLMFADAVIGKDGMAVIRGVFPVDLLGMGAHHIRVVGERVLDTVLANSRGQVMFPAFAITAIHQFDAKTMATVSIDGMSANNTPLTLVRVVALGASISWWTLLFPAVLLLAALLAVVLGWVRRRRNRVLVNVVVFGGSIVPIVTGWHEGVFALANAGFDIGFGAIVLVQLLPNLRNERVVRERSQFFGYRFERRSDRLKGRNVYEEDEMGSAYSPYQRGSQWRRRIERRIGARPTRPIGVSADQFEADRSGRERTRPSASKRSHGQEELSEKLAGRPNLILFLERVGQALARASGDDSKIAVLYFNLDGFRVFNDAKGKEYGDVLLQVVAERLRATIGDDDVLAHLAADEYAILCNDVADEADAHSRAEQILKAFKRPFVLADGEVMASASIGIALGDQYASPSALVEDAEIALHTAKKVGRGGVRIYDVGIRKRAEYRFTLDGALHHALARNELFLAYQPIASLRTRRYVGVEALLRWRHPELGVIGPEEFIPVAEENGLIVPIGTWVLERACEQLRLWRDASPEASGWLMSVNAAALQLRALDFPDVIERSLEHSGLMSSDLRIELTESALIESGVATDVLRRLRELGVRISIDDFGIKYSSLSYLTRLPIDELKIDESFIGGLVGDESMQAIVAAILTIGRSLGLTVTAEGVETEAQLIELLMLGCDSVQGFLFEKPLPPDECFTALMGTPRPPLGRKL